MERVSRILHFPDELLVHISHYLSVRDILSCCLVCHRLRELLNDDKVWRRRVSSQAISRLGARDQLVAPPLLVPDTFGEQRTLFAWHTRLINNWRSGTRMEFDTWTQEGFEQDDFEGVSHFYGDSYMFVGWCRKNNENSRVEVWDVRSKPVLYTTVVSNIRHYVELYIIGTKLLIIDCYKVAVYEIKLPEIEFPLLYSFVFEEQSVTLGRNVVHPDHCDCDKMGWQHDIVDRFLISSKIKDENEAMVLEIWDISEGTKLGSFPTPIPGFSTVFRFKVGDKWCFQQSQCSNEEYCLLQFDITTKQFSD